MSRSWDTLRNPWVALAWLIASLVAALSLLLPTHVCAVSELSFLMWKPDHPDVWAKAIQMFEERSGIKVNVTIGPHSSSAAHAMVTQKLKNRDQDPDVFLMDVIWPSEFVSAGWIQPLGTFFPPDQRADFFPGAIEACTIKGRIYGVPCWTSGGLLYYRRDLLKKYGFRPPDTWEQLVEQAERIVNLERPHDPALKGYSGQFKQYEGLVCNMLEFVLSNRGSFFGQHRSKSTLDDPHNVGAIRFVRDKIIGRCASRAVLTYEEPESLHVFIQGHAVFLRNWPYAWEIANNPDKSRVAGNVDITVLPRFEHGDSVSTLGGWQFALSRFSRRKALAWEFIRFMTSPEMQKFFALQASQTPARRSVYEDPEVLRTYPHFAKLKHVFENARPRPAIPLYPLYSHIVQSFYQHCLAYPQSRVPVLARQADERVNRLLGIMREGGMQ